MKQLVIKKKDENENLILLLEDGVLVEKHIENVSKKNIEGNIFIGKVQNVLPGLDSAFINIGKSKNAFISTKELLPKIDVTKKNQLENKKINEIIRPGDPVLVQVKKDSNIRKGVCVTTHINISSRFIALCPNTPFITVSQKISDTKRKEELKQLVRKHLENKNLGAIVRTNAEFTDDEDIQKDIKKLLKIWNNIKDKEILDYPVQLYDSGGIIQKIIIDTIDCGLEKIIVENSQIFDEVQNILKLINVNVQVQIDDKDILYNYNLDRQLPDSERRKIWLKNGGFITIDKTEALTAIDVNSGKDIGKKDIEKTIFEVNYEATLEIAKQIRLRDIGGIIIIDYINMNSKDNKLKIEQLLRKEVLKDRTKVQVEGFTKLNLMELTRKHLYNNS